MMTRINFEKLFFDICLKHNVKLFLNDPNVAEDNGYAISNEIHLGRKYKNVHIYMAIAFHEFSHAIINKKREAGIKRYNVNCCFMEEWFAWSLAMRYYAKYIKRPFTKTMGNFVLSCLQTHSQSHYAFKDIFKDDMS